ncbi:WD40/YVTN/BNR-like repeat-containing protein [Nannocystis punicea]|uniref:Photosynthesis system II assembly factor Ycf48/Hcf136-like domain-containing protein n=1 Tax=Nannocystis punicea TaxID=2995304 RepID=A0ABY7H6F8_9BACT|nr:hypothetical protein [Nannocystis poenicansa]WAS94645.1 hypothetical protein O0S08_00660 [Nannocystis poenicansa]
MNLAYRLRMGVVGLGVGLVAAFIGCKKDNCFPDNHVEVTQELSHVEVTLRGVAASANDGAVVVGDAGTILRRTGAGTWLAQTSGVTVDLFAVASPHPLSSTMVAVGAGGTILRSVDDGRTWKPSASGTTAELYGVWLAEDEGLALAVGEQVVLRSDNAGFTWSMGQVPKGTGALRGVAGREGELFAVGDHTQVLRSDDEGRTWERVAVESAGDLLAVVVDRYDLPVEGDTDPFLVAGQFGVFRLFERFGLEQIQSVAAPVSGLSADGAWWVDGAGAIYHQHANGSARLESDEPPAALMAVDGSREAAIAVGDDGTIVRAELLELGCVKGFDR